LAVLGIFQGFVQAGQALFIFFQVLVWQREVPIRSGKAVKSLLLFSQRNRQLTVENRKVITFLGTLNRSQQIEAIDIKRLERILLVIESEAFEDLLGLIVTGGIVKTDRARKEGALPRLLVFEALVFTDSSGVSESFLAGGFVFAVQDFEELFGGETVIYI
jgi:hypothetical protein